SRRDALCRSCVHHRQPRGGRPLWRHRPTSEGGLTAKAIAERVPAIRVRLARVLRQPLVLIGLVVVILWILVAIMAPIVSPHDPLDQGTELFQQPSSQHWLGTDELGRDVFSRLLWGARVSVPLSIFLVAVSLAFGATLGGLAGYLGGWVDEIIM